MENHHSKDLKHACSIHINACEGCIDHCQKFIASCAQNTDEIVCAKEVGALINVCAIVVRTGKNLIEVCQKHMQSDEQNSLNPLLKKCVPLTEQCVAECQACTDKARRASDRSKKLALECIRWCTDSANICAEIMKN